ncbi:ATP-binding cassette domain-containing protein [Rhizosphaericola mali]|nr:ATP-binding cassette domain-containing protein [Rhizosphaericola mali]
MISGILAPDNGFVQLNENVIYSSDTNIYLPTTKRKIGFIFQDGALFPHMNVLENIQYGANFHNIEALTNDLQISHLLKKKVYELSGGQKQAVALARALANEPSLLLMDEPLSAVDSEWQVTIIEYIKKYQQQKQIPILYVSHSSDEIKALCTKMVLIKDYKSSSIMNPLEYFQEEIIEKSKLIKAENGNYALLISDKLVQNNNNFKISLIK